MSSADQKALWERMRRNEEEAVGWTLEWIFDPRSTEAQIAAVEAELKFKFPSTFRESFKYQDGAQLSALVAGALFLTLERIGVAHSTSNSQLSKHAYTDQTNLRQHSAAEMAVFFGRDRFVCGLWGDEDLFYIDVSDGEQVKRVDRKRKKIGWFADNFIDFLHKILEIQEKSIALEKQCGDTPKAQKEFRAFLEPYFSGLKPKITQNAEGEHANDSLQRFELIEGNTRKFWEVQAAQTLLTVRFGRIGSTGQTQTKAFENALATQVERDRLIAEKTAKGYVEITVANGATLTAVTPKPAKAAKEVDEITLEQLFGRLFRATQKLAQQEGYEPPELWAMGVTEEALREFESEFRLELPQQLRLALSLYGEIDDLLLAYTLFSTDGMALAYQDFDEFYVEDDNFTLMGPVQMARSKADRVFFATNVEQDNFAIDLYPAEGGTLGQVVRYHLEGGELEVMAPSYVDFLKRLLRESQ
jgi:predicted DNA-binding WGR domain protein/cell wall assembly regulator SMI1